MYITSLALKTSIKHRSQRWIDFYFPTYNLSYFVNNYSQPPDLSIALTVLQYGGKNN